MRRKSLYYYDNLADKGIDNLPLNSTLMVKELDTIYTYDNNTGVDLNTTVEEAIENSNLKTLKFDGRDMTGYMPNPFNLPITRSGDASFLPLPIDAASEGSAVVWGGGSAFIADKSGKTYLLEMRTNGTKDAVYLSYLDNNKYNPLTFEYRPNFILDNEIVEFIYDCTSDGVCIRVGNSDNDFKKYYWVKYNNSANQADHTEIEITKILSKYEIYSFTLIYIKEKKIFLMMEPEDSHAKYSIYSESLAFIDSYKGYKLDDSYDEVEYPSGTYYAKRAISLTSNYRSYLNYIYTGGKIHVKSIPNTSYNWYSNGSPRRRYASYLDYFTIDSNNHFQRIDPSEGLPLKFENSPEQSYIFNSNNTYWYPKKPLNIFGDLMVNMTRNISIHYSYHLEKCATGETYETYNEAFNDNFNKFDFHYTNRYIKDSSVIGKESKFSGLLRLSDGNDYVITDGTSFDGTDYVHKFALIEGVNISDLEGYNPSGIIEVKINPRITSFVRDSSGVNSNNRLFDFRTKSGDNTKIETVEYVDKAALISGTATVVKTLKNIKDSSKMDDLIDDYIAAKGVTTSTVTHKFGDFHPIADTKFLMVNLGFTYKEDASNEAKVSAYFGYCIVNGDTEATTASVKDYFEIHENTNYHHYQSADIPMDIDPSNWYLYCIRKQDAFVIDEENNEITALVVGSVPGKTGGSNLDFVHFKLNVDGTFKSNPSNSRQSYNPNCSGYSRVGCHPDERYTFYEVYNGRVDGQSKRGITSFFAGTPTSLKTHNYSSRQIINTIRSAVGLRLYTSDFPALINGFDLKFKETSYQLSANSTQYIYMIEGNGEAKLDFKNANSIQNPLKISKRDYHFIGSVQTDNIGIIDMHIDKSTNLGGIIEGDTSGLIIAPNLTYEKIEQGGSTSLATRDYVVNHNQAMPNPFNLPVSRVGDSSFMDLPIYGEAAGTAYIDDAVLVPVPHSDGKIYFFQSRTDINTKGVYLSRIKDDLTGFESFSKKYQPNFIPSSEKILEIQCSTSTGMLIKANDGSSDSYYWISFNGSANESNHTSREATALFNKHTDQIDQSVQMYFIEKLDIWIKRRVDTTDRYRWKYSVYNSDYSTELAQIDGIDTSESGGFWDYGSNIVRVWDQAGSNQKANKSMFKIVGNIIEIKSHLPTTYSKYDSSRNRNVSYHPTGVEHISFDKSSSVGTLIEPNSGWPVNATIDGPNLRNGTWGHSLYWYKFHVVPIYDKLIFTEQMVANTTMQRLYIDNLPSTTYKSYNDAFDKNFYWFEYTGSLTTTDINHPDFSPIGKNIKFSRLIRLGGVDYGITDGYSLPLNSFDNNIVRKFALIRNVDLDNPTSYSPDDIIEIQNNPRIHYFEYDGTNSTNTVLYDQYDDGEMKYYEFTDIADLSKNMVQDMVYYKKVSLFYANLQARLNAFVADTIPSGESSHKNSSIYQYFHIPGTDYLLITLVVTWCPDTAHPEELTSVSSLAVWDPVNDTYKVDLHEVSRVEKLSSMSYFFSRDRPDSYTPQEKDYAIRTSIGFIKDTSNDKYYFSGLFYVHAYTSGTNLIHCTGSFKLNSSTFTDAPKLIRRWAGAWGRNIGAGVHQHEDFKMYCNYNGVDPIQYLVSDSRRIKGATPDDAVAKTQEDDTVRWATITAAMGLFLYVSEFPLMISGYYTKMPAQKLSLGPNRTRYLYATIKDGKPIIAQHSSLVTQTTELVYIGKVVTDNIQVTSFEKSKIFIQDGIVIDSGNRTITADLTNSKIDEGGDKSLITKEYLIWYHANH